MSNTKAWFPTLIYHAPLMREGLRSFNAGLVREAGQIRDYDEAGQRWSKVGYPGGYTSYGSLDRLHQFSSSFDTLRKAVDRHARSYARKLDWDLRGARLTMSDCWLNIMPRGCAHSFHLHPHAVISGTYYLRVPRGAPGLRFEDPRLSSMMAAPMRKADSASQAHIVYPAKAGDLILFESWLRHEVPPNPVEDERVSVSFNYHWS
ncbi:hypothetical protein D0B54_13840 [Solimonas sp. K1W22B-7]|uniref:TIGR02466 family protein n=1 Tax=Solimonas sp. K1W22B-7 TaxID=2303331 RepID=UPI000E334DC7|nr:TIGR02466 family protein [Solimonas sp. K1W22B-7]AXQ29691.1 hypothetical protein D0B54_13840 [Solimonas sp. K1W22B-7]